MFNIGDQVKCIDDNLSSWFPFINNILTKDHIYKVDGHHFGLLKLVGTMGHWADTRFELHKEIDYLAITREFG